MTLSTLTRLAFALVAFGLPCVMFRKWPPPADATLLSEEQETSEGVTV